MLRLAALGQDLRGSGRERVVLGSIWGLGCAGLVLGLALPPSASTSPGLGTQLLDDVRILLTFALAATIVMGPGLAVRAVAAPRLRLAFLPLPGLGLLAITGLVAWLLGLAGWVHPRVVSVLVLAPTLALIAGAIARSDSPTLMSEDEWFAISVIGGALGIAIARSAWSLGPVNELFGGTIYKTLEATDRSDSRISYQVAMLVTHGQSPWGAVSNSYFAPYTFSSRGPLAGLASTPLALASGGTPPEAVGTPLWTPFDAQGFMAYRIAMMAFAGTCFLSVWTLVKQLAGVRAARFAVLLAATTPFLVHEVWFTWPKLLAASMALLAGICVLDRRWVLAGILIGVGYLVHPLALLSLPALLLIALWPLRGAVLRRPRLVGPVILIVAALVFLFAWKEINGPHYTQSGFFSYVTQSGNFDTWKSIPTTLGRWLSDRLSSLGNTLVPFALFLFGSHNQDVNWVNPTCFPFCSGGSPGIIHFFYEYWDSVPFGFGILFFPFLLEGLWAGLRRWRWAIVATVVVPFLVFWVYWGSANTGLTREGLHAWALTVIVALAVVEGARGFRWLRSRPVRAILSSRVIETLLVAMLPTLVTAHRVLASQFWLSDLVAVLAMVACAAFLIARVWQEGARAEHQTNPSPTESSA
ncbi:MAG: glycosyltransferase family 39 protein [Solirubrobacterales bacterium]|nr:glycosyltransferase family 39 protein [Solirubrobacterales bacterium]